MAIQNTTVKFKDFNADSFNAFIEAVENCGEYEKKSYYPVDEKSHFERYNFLNKRAKTKISIVYDTKAKILSLTSPIEEIEKLQKFIYSKPSAQVRCEPAINTEQNKIELPKAVLQTGANKPPKTKNQAGAHEQIKIKNQTNEKKTMENNLTENNNRPLKDETKKAIEPLNGNALKSINGQGQQDNSKQNKTENTPQAKNVQKQQKVKQSQIIAEQKNEDAEFSQENTSLEYKNGYTVKKYDSARFDKVLEIIKGTKGLFLKTETTGAANTEIKAFMVEDKNKQKLYLRFLPQKHTVMLQGKPSELFLKIQTVISKGAEYKTAVSSYIKQSGEDETLQGIEKKLRKLIPDAFEYLSEQSKKDLTFALIDINNVETRLSDYSGLLLSPYRGLERLIYDLQSAQGIKVKMIGQAYDKRPDGSYCIKSGYLKKIQSVIYNEVMSALYTEYFEKRNFYLHSDNSELSSQRVIKEKSEAKKIFDNLLQIINYNCIKLKEIGFSISQTEYRK